MMKKNSIYITELSTTRHTFHKYHFCRGNSSRRKSRLGVIIKGSGTYIYLSKKLRVAEGDVVFIPENIYCYSEWHGDDEIEVVYLSCFMHYESFKYEPQIIDVIEDVKNDILGISTLLMTDDEMECLEAYSRFYKLLQSVIVKMIPSDITYDKALMSAVEYITDNWDQDFSVAELAKRCCVSESALYHMFQKELGQTPVKFLNSIRINIAIEHLENSSYSVATISEMVGFHSENHFRKVFADFTGTTPLKYRKYRS